jgi:hypothetical protein
MAANGAGAKNGYLHPASPSATLMTPASRAFFVARTALRAFRVTPSCCLSFLKSCLPQWTPILQAFRVRTMPILLSINPPFELLLPSSFGIVKREKIIGMMTSGRILGGRKGESELTRCCMRASSNSSRRGHYGKKIFYFSSA